MDRLLLESQQPVQLDTIRELRYQLEQVVQVSVPHSSIQQRMLLCLSEAVTNLVQHTSFETQQIKIRFGRNTSGWWLDILDDGLPWDPTKYIQTRDSNELYDVETESGRGIALLYKQCDSIDYSPSSSNNDVPLNNASLNQLRLYWDRPDKNKRPKILLVEDDEILRRIYLIYLQEIFEVTTANSGIDALLKLKRKQVDLVLSDICMPEMDGVVLRQKLSEDPELRLLPFVFMSAVNNSPLMEQVNSLGIDDYLHKPVDKAQLIQTLQRVLKRSQQINQTLTERLNERITSSLTPRLPEHSHGWRFAVASRHTGVGGGDLLLHQSGENQFQLVLTDIMGHDDSAKFFAHACGGYLHGIMKSLEAESNPAYLLEQLSDFAIEDKLFSQVTLTCCSMILSTTGKVNIASAGHPPPLLINQSGVKSIAVSGMLPGLLEDTKYQPETLQLATGERIALYTDGLFESAMNNNVRKVLENRITATLLETLNLPVNESLTQVMNVFDDFVGTPPADDALLLLIEVDN